MEIYFQIYLIFEVVTLLHSASISHPPQSPRDPQILENATNIINDGLSSSSFLFKVFQSDMKDKQTDSYDGDMITFMMKETLCLKPEENFDKCPFREGGAVKRCIAMFSGPEETSLTVICNTEDSADGHPQGGQAEETPGQKMVTRRRSVPIYNRDKKAISKKSSLDTQSAASCLTCIFDWLKPNTRGGRR